MAIPLEEFDVYMTDKDGVVHKNESQDRFLKDMINRVIPKAEKDGKKEIIVLSGAMGSGKSLAVQFLINWLCINYPGMQWGMGRISVKVARDTFFKELKVMTPAKVLATDNKENITFKNKSDVSVHGWGDGSVSRIRSNNWHGFVLEEVTEDAGKAGNFELNYKAFKEVLGRVRLSGAPNLIFLITNPDDPDTHWLFREFIDKAGYVDGQRTKDTKERKERVSVYYSVTTDNPYLDKAYKEDMLKNLSPSEGQRAVFGKWCSIKGQGVYSEYDDDLHWHPDKDYKINKSYPILWSNDFNTASGAPMSSCIGQYIDDEFHMYDECVIDNSNTRGVLMELEGRGFFRQFQGSQELHIMGDAAGWAKQEAVGWNNYSVMRRFLDVLPYTVNYKIKVPASNPAIIGRHNLVNSYLKNMLGDVRVFIYDGCETLRRALKTTQLKKGANYLEDSTNRNQHIGTGFGYMAFACTKKKASFKKG